MPTVMVGGRPESASELEYFLATLPEGTPVEWSGSRSPGTPSGGVGVLLFTWWYDGVVAEIDSGGRRIRLHPDSDSGLRVTRLEDARLPCGRNLVADGSHI